jgi:Family of unknown function (DUF6188)
MHRHRDAIKTARQESIILHEHEGVIPVLYDPSDPPKSPLIGLAWRRRPPTGRTTPAPAAAATQQAAETPVAQLTKLMDLCERGMLTDAEYEARKGEAARAVTLESSVKRRSRSGRTTMPNDYYEAWQLHGPRNLAVVCSPGGDSIAVFEPDAQE